MLAVSDICVMVCGFLIDGLPGVSGSYVNSNFYNAIAPYLLGLAHTSVMTSVYFAVLMAFERYVRICYTCRFKSTKAISQGNLK